MQTARGFVFEVLAKELLQAVVALLRNGTERLEKLAWKVDGKGVLEGGSCYFFRSEMLDDGEESARERKGRIML